MAGFFFILSNIPCTVFLYSFVYRWTLPCLAYCEECCKQFFLSSSSLDFVLCEGSIGLWYVKVLVLSVFQVTAPAWTLGVPQLLPSLTQGLLL